MAVADGRLGQLLHISDTSIGPDDIRLAGARDIASACHAIGVAESFDQLAEPDPIGGQPRGIRSHRVFLHVAALDIDTRDTRHVPELRRDDPVLHGSQVSCPLQFVLKAPPLRSQITAACRRAFELHRPDKHLAQSSGERPHRKLDIVGEAASGRLHTFVH